MMKRILDTLFITLLVIVAVVAVSSIVNEPMIVFSWLLTP